tara:strand:+ start:257 stop:397 length:141 start_codon:yes stop_codon:yes gene_type:complete
MNTKIIMYLEKSKPSSNYKYKRDLMKKLTRILSQSFEKKFSVFQKN